jgi:putative transcriptional regulator
MKKRKELSLTQEQMSDKLSISRQYYNEIENFKRTPSVNLAKEIGKLLKLDWAIFFS